MEQNGWTQFMIQYMHYFFLLYLNAIYNDVILCPFPPSPSPKNWDLIQNLKVKLSIELKECFVSSCVGPQHRLTMKSVNYLGGFSRAFLKSSLQALLKLIEEKKKERAILFDFN